MGNKVTNREPTKIEDVEYELLFGSILDFAKVATLVESEITRHRVLDKQRRTVQDQYGRTYEDMWASLKTVSHFNLGIALELMLKLLLTRNLRAIPQGWRGHQLTILHDDLPESVKQKLESTFQGSRRVAPDGPDIVALVAITAAGTSGLPKGRGRKSLRDFFEYLDQVVRLSVKRYSYEEVQQQRPRHYLYSLSVFTTFIDRVLGNIKRYVDPKARAEHGGTGNTGNRTSRAVPGRVKTSRQEA